MSALYPSSVFSSLVEGEKRGTNEEKRREHGSILARLEKVAELKKLLTLYLFSRRLFKLQAKISGHAVSITALQQV